MKDKDIKIIDIKGKKYIKEQFLVEDSHPAIGRILIIGDMKFKVMDEPGLKGHRTGTFIAPLNERDEEIMEQYDEDLELLSEKLVDRVDIKRLIKENIKCKPHQEIKTGLFILKAKDDGEDIEEEHHKGCYQYKAHYKGQQFEFMSGDDCINDGSLVL